MSDLDPAHPDDPNDPLSAGRPSGGLPWYTDLMVTSHLLLTRDHAQHEAWTERIDAVELEEVMSTVPSVQVRQRLRRPGVWRRIRKVGLVGATSSTAVAIPWLAWLMTVYAEPLGFGWGVASTFLLAMPFMWWTARHLFERAAIATLAHDDDRPERRWRTAGLLTFTSGFGAGFVLVFLQGLLTWFMTPAPTIGMEVMIDASVAAMAGVFFGALTLWLTPLVAMVGERTARAFGESTAQGERATEVREAQVAAPAYTVVEERG